MTQITKEAIEAAEREFTEYFVRNYPGPDTIIFDPKWHAPKLFRAATRSLISSPGKDGGQEVEAVAWQTFNEDQNRWAQCTEADAEAINARGGSVRPLYTRPQPASTALVERLTKAAGAIANNQLLTGEALAELSAAYRALSASQSTSREGER